MKRFYSILTLFLASLGTVAVAQNNVLYTQGDLITSADQLTEGKYFISVASKGIEGFIQYGSGFFGNVKEVQSFPYRTIDASYVYEIIPQEAGTFFVKSCSSGKYLPIQGGQGYAKGNIGGGVDSPDGAALLKLNTEVNIPYGDGIKHWVVYADGCHMENNEAYGISYIHNNDAGFDNQHLSWWEKYDVNAGNTGVSNAAIAFYKAVPAKQKNVTYHYRLGTTEEYIELGSRVVSENIEYVPTEKLNLPAYLDFDESNFPETISADVNSENEYTIYTTYNSNLPFTISTDANPVYYILNFNQGNYWWYAGNSDSKGKEVDNLNGYTVEAQGDYKWTIAGDWFNGFTIKSQSGKYIAAPGNTASYDNNTAYQVDLVNEASSASKFELTGHGNTDMWRFKLGGTTVDSKGANINIYLAHTSMDDLNLTLYYDTARPDYAGGPTLFTEAGDFDTEIEELCKKVDDYLSYKGVGYPVESAPVRTELNAAREQLKTTQNRTNYNNVLTKITAYESATNVDMPEDGKAYLLHNVQQSGDGFLLVANDNSENEDTELGIVDYTNENKKLTKAVFVCHKVGDKYIFTNGEKGKYLIWKGNGNGYKDDKGILSDYEANFCDFTLQSRADTKFQTFTLLSKRNNSTDGTIVITSRGTFDAYNNSVGWTSGYSNLFVLEPVDYPYNNVTLREPTSRADGENFKYATIFLPFATTIPAGVEAYTATREGKELTLHAVSETLPANTAVVLRSTETTEALFVPATTAGDEIEDNVLEGTINTDVSTQPNTYVLNGNFEAGIGFYSYIADYLPAGKAYLVAADVSEVDGAGVKGLLFGGQTATAIDSATAEGNVADDAPCYDLSGRRVAAPAKGIYIRGGKKVFIK